MKLKSLKFTINILISTVLMACGSHQKILPPKQQPAGAPLTESIDDNEGKEYVTIDSRKLYFTEKGSGPAVLILHGADADIDNQFNAQIEFLAENGFRAIYLERAGRGRSDASQVRLTISGDSKDSLRFMEALQIPQYFLLAHSAGASVAKYMAQTNPSRILGIISIDSGSFAKLNRNMLEALPVDRYDPEDQDAHTRNIQALTSLNRPFDYPSDFNTATILNLKEKNSRINPWRWVYFPELPNQSEADLCLIPTLAIVSGRGKVKQNDPEAIELEQNTPCAEILIVTKSGHYIHMEHPEITNQAVFNFLRDI